MQCRKHPERAAAAVCQKHGVGFCAECCECADAVDCCGCVNPTVYCTFRTQCLIWERARERRRDGGGEGASA